MSGLFDWLKPSKEGSLFDIFGPPKSKRKEEGPALPALPAPKSQLPTVHRENLPSPKRSIKEKLLSIFDFMPPAKKEGSGLILREKFLPPSLIPAQDSRMVEPPRESPWEAMFSEPSEEERPLREMFSHEPVQEPSQGEVSRYEFIHGIKRLPYAHGAEPWSLPSYEELAQHLESKIDLEKVFEQLEADRSTQAYQDLLVESTFNGVPLYTPITVIDDKNLFTDFADFYGITWNVVEQIKDEEEFHALLRDLNMVLTEALETLKPEGLPGFFTIGYNAQKMNHWLYYVEPWMGRIPGP